MFLHISQLLMGHSSGFEKPIGLLLETPSSLIQSHSQNPNKTLEPLLLSLALALSILGSSKNRRYGRLAPGEEAGGEEGWRGRRGGSGL